MVTLRWEDLDLPEARRWVRELTCRRPVPLSARLCDHLSGSALLSGWVFPGRRATAHAGIHALSNRVRAVAEVAGLSRVNPEQLRRAAGGPVGRAASAPRNAPVSGRSRTKDSPTEKKGAPAPQRRSQQRYDRLTPAGPPTEPQQVRLPGFIVVNRCQPGGSITGGHSAWRSLRRSNRRNNTRHAT
jgi:hypothetical protein